MTNQEKLELMKSKNPVLSSLVDRLDLVVSEEPIKMPIPGISHIPKYAETSQPLFSIFKEPITNKVPIGEVSLRQIYKAIMGSRFKERTIKCRQLLNEHSTESKKVNGRESNPYRLFKIRKFPYATFAGTFTKRHSNFLKNTSGYYPMDLDHIEDVDAVRAKILTINDPYFKTCLLYTSPSGGGLKWIITIEKNNYDYSTNYKGLCVYINEVYQIQLDTTSDISRACFLCHDPNAYYNAI